MISDMEPRSKAITGVPHAMASTTESPNGSSKSIKWRRAAAPPRQDERSCALDGPDEVHVVAIEARGDLAFEVELVLNDAGDSQGHLYFVGDSDRRHQA